jgi:uncharacterized protein
VIILIEKIRSSPLLARVIPFAIFAALTLLQGQLGEAMQYWIYALKTLVCAWLLWLVRSQVKEMNWKLSWEAVAVGIAVFLTWVGLDGHYPLLAHRTGSFNPMRTYGNGDLSGVIFVVVRILGSSIVVPPLEEIFYRSFLYRFIKDSDFLKIPLERFEWMPFLFAGMVFGIGHYEWLPGILCAFAYQGLVCWKKRLSDAIMAHSVTNFLLGLWVVFREAYYFW